MSTKVGSGINVSGTDVPYPPTDEDTQALIDLVNALFERRGDSLRVDPCRSWSINGWSNQRYALNEKLDGRTVNHFYDSIEALIADLDRRRQTRIVRVLVDLAKDALAQEDYPLADVIDR